MKQDTMRKRFHYLRLSRVLFVISCICFVGCNEEPASPESTTPDDLLQQFSAASGGGVDSDFCRLVDLICSDRRFSPTSQCDQLRQDCTAGGESQDARIDKRPYDAGHGEDVAEAKDAGDRELGRHAGTSHRRRGASGNDATAEQDAGAQQTGICNTVQTINDDMTLDPDIPPPSYTNGYPHVAVGVNAPSWANSVTAWGVIYRFGNDTNTAVQARNIRTYILHASGKWELYEGSTNVGYHGYKDDFSGFADLENERAMPDGGVAAKIPSNTVFHFWPSGDDTKIINMGDLAGIYTTFEARLIVNDPSKPDDTESSLYVGQAGADYYGNGKCCYEDGGEIAMGRFKFVTTQWQWYSMTTVSANQFKASNPPLDCAN